MGVIPAAGAVGGGDLPVAAQQPAIGQQPLDTDRTARVQLVGADADLGAQAVAEAVGEAIAGVVEDAAGVDRGQEPLGGARGRR